MRSQQRQSKICDLDSILFKSISIKVKFTCKCYLQYQIEQEIYHTKQIEINNKQIQYQINELVSLDKLRWIQSNKKWNDLKITVKLLSNKGLTFTVGYFIINYQTVSKWIKPYQLKTTKIQDIQVCCVIQYIKKSINSSFSTPRKQSHQICNFSYENMNQLTHSQKSKNSRLQNEFEQLRDDYLKLKDKFSKYEQFNNVQSGHKQYYSYRKGNEQKHEQQYEQLDVIKQRNLLLQCKIRQLQRQIIRNNELFNKQKEIILIFESGLKQKTIQYEQLKNINKQLANKYQQISKHNYLLEEQKIKIMMEQLRIEKQKYNLTDYMVHMFDNVYHVIENIFNKKINNITSLAHSKQLHKNNNKLYPSSSGSSPLAKKLFYSTDFHKREQSPQKNDIEDISISVDFENSEYNMPNNNLTIKNIFKQYELREQNYIETIKLSCVKIQKIVNGSVNKLFKKILQLISYNKYYKRQLNEQKQQYENNEEQLINYLEQIEQILQQKLLLIKQKDEQIININSMIEQLKGLLQQKQYKILELQQNYEILYNQKEQIKSQLHQNNYIYSIKQQQFLKKIYQLENGFQHPNYININTQKSNIINRKQTVLSQNNDSSDNINHSFENQIIYQSPLMHQQFQQLNPSQVNFYPYDNDEANLRYTMLKKHRNSLINKLRQQINSDQNVKSICQKENSNSQQQKVIQQQFLKVLV